jgi:GNAT superfamily N-acetyltransferase
LTNFTGQLRILDSSSPAVEGDPIAAVLGVDNVQAVPEPSTFVLVGTALLAAAEDEARRRGLPYMALMVTDENAPALGLYARSGYRTERRLLCKPL